MKNENIPEEDAAVLNKYAIWNPEVNQKDENLCHPCSHCSPDLLPVPDQDIARNLHGECHCHPCGSCGRSLPLERKKK